MFIFTQHIINYYGTNGTNPRLKEKEKQPTYLGSRRFAHGDKSIHSGPLSGIKCPPLTFQSLLTPTYPLGPYYITMMTSTTSVFLSGTITLAQKTVQPTYL
jgi:hypothetical protein